MLIDISDKVKGYDVIIGMYIDSIYCILHIYIYTYYHIIYTHIYIYMRVQYMIQVYIYICAWTVYDIVYDISISDFVVT